MTPRSDLATITTVSQFVGFVLLVGVLGLAQAVLVPFALGLLLSFLLSPLVNLLSRRGVNNALAVVVTGALAFIVFVGGLALIGREVSTFVVDLPKYKEELLNKARTIANLRSSVGGSFGSLMGEMTTVMEDADQDPKGDKPGAADTTAMGTDKLDDTEGSPESPSGVPLSPPPVNVEGSGIISSEDPSGRTGRISSRSDARTLGPTERAQGQWWLEDYADRVFSRAERRATNVHDGTSPNSPLYTTVVETGATPFLSWAGTVGTVLGPLGTLGLVFVFTLFLLVYRDDLRDRIIAVISRGNYVTTTEALDEVSYRISRYLIAQSILNFGYGLVMFIGLYLIGLFLAPDGTFPNAILWGVLAGVMRFVPYAGPVVGASFPLTISLIVFPGYSVFAAVLVWVVCIELASNNLIEPWVYGSSTGISSLAVIFGAVFWGWLWGPVGLLLATPLTVCLVVLGRHVTRFKIFATLFGGELHVSPSIRFYQRLLASDTHRAREMLNGYIAENGIVKAGDDVLVPTLKRLRQDRTSEELSGENSAGLLRAIEQLLGEVNAESTKECEAAKQVAKELAKSSDDPLVESPTVEELLTLTQLPQVYGVAAHHVAEELSLRFLSKAMCNNCRLEVAEHNELPSSVTEWVAKESPAAVVIGIVPLGGFVQARYLSRSMREQGYTGPIVVACFGRFKNYDRLFMRFRKAGATYMTTSMEQTHRKLESLLGRSGKGPRSPAKLSSSGPQVAAAK